MERIRSSTAVLLANELDKAVEGKSSRSTADILLTILDKTGFYENFLEEIIPTDNLFCIATCNDLSKISKPLRDRFMVIKIPGYTPGEKKVIFRDYVLPSMLKRNGMAADRMSVAEEAVEEAAEETVEDLQNDYRMGLMTEEGKGVAITQEGSGEETPLNKQLAQLGKWISTASFMITGSPNSL